MNNQEKIQVMLWHLIWVSLGINFFIFSTIFAWTRANYLFLLAAGVVIALTILERRISISIRGNRRIKYFDIVFFGLTVLFSTVFCTILVYFDVSWGGVMIMSIAAVLEAAIGIILTFRMREK